MQQQSIISSSQNHGRRRVNRHNPSKNHNQSSIARSMVEDASEDFSNIEEHINSFYKHGGTTEEHKGISN